MRKPHLLLIIFPLYFVSCKKESQETPIKKQWNTIAEFPGIGRYAATGFSIGDKFYVGLGRGRENNSEQDLQDFYEYNSTTNTWTQKGDFSGGIRAYARGFSINGKGYVAMGQRYCISGCTDTIFRDFWEYEPANDSWKKVVTFDNVDENLAIGGQVFVINSKAYLNYRQNLWEFEAATYSLKAKAPFPDYTAGMNFFNLNNKAYSVGGYYDGNGNYTKNVYQYDPSIDKWSKKADFPGHERAVTYSFSVNGKGYIGCGGYTTQKLPNTSYLPAYLQDVWEYSDSNDSWSQVADFPQLGLASTIIATVGSKVIIGTGIEVYSSPLEDFEKRFWSY